MSDQPIPREIAERIVRAHLERRTCGIIRGEIEDAAMKAERTEDRPFEIGVTITSPRLFGSRPLDLSLPHTVVLQLVDQHADAMERELAAASAAARA